MADPDVAARLERAAGARVSELRRIGGGHGAAHYRAVLADGRELFLKSVPSRPADAVSATLRAEATGLRWLAEADVALVPEVFFSANEMLALPWLPPASADRAAAERFGRDLALLHWAGADSFGAPWPGYIASLPLGNDEADSWPAWYAAHRLLPYARLGRDAGTLGSADVSLIESVASRIDDLAGPAEPPSRTHGDCWSGNVLWSGGQGWLVDPAAHGGHRESDLAMLALFGAPYLDAIMAAYRETRPLADGWQSRVPLHQLHPLLVHVCLFGSGYREAAVAAARAALS
jgi:fructosamine-3-kinase